MTNGRGKDAGMGETAKSLIKDIWIADKYGRRPQVFSKQMRKGIECEEDSLSLYTTTQCALVTKNEVNYSNDFITGTPDAFNRDLVVDVKTSWDIWTFSKSELTPLYEWQLRGYMMLLNLPEAHLAYCLVDMPNSLLSDELYRLQYNFTNGEDNPEYDNAAEQLKRNSIYSDIPASERIKVFKIVRDIEKEEQIINRVKEGRQLYETLTL
jgi:hypothetical protein